MHDPNYRRLFAFPRMVADLLRAVAQGDWIGDVDLDTLEKLLIAAPAALLPCQPSQRSLLLDERHARVDDLPLGNLMRAVVAFEQSRTAGDLAQAAAAAAEWLRSPGDAELNRAFASWLGQMVARMKPEHAEVALGGTLEEAAMTLVERVAQWPEQWRQEGVAQGVAQGRREGVVEERALLRRLTAVRFGEAIARQVADLLENTDDWDQLAAVAELIVRARRGPQLLEEIARRLRQPDKGLAP